MKAKLLLVIGLGVGYVLGTRAGRERYDQMKSQVTKVWESPRVSKARREVEAYAKQQAPIIRDRAEAIAKAAPGVIADTVKDVAEKTATVAKDVAAKTAATAKDVAHRVADVADDVRDQAVKTVHDIRDRGETAVERAVAAVGAVRDGALIDDLDNSSDDELDRVDGKPGTSPGTSRGSTANA
jgi:sRNA-binding protein